MKFTTQDGQAVIAAAAPKASDIEAPMNIALLDGGARLKALLRMNRAVLGSILLTATLFIGDFCMAQSASDIEMRNKSVIKASFDAWRDGTGSPFDLLAETATWTIVGRSVASKTYPNREAFMSEVIRPFNARLSGGLKPTIRNIYADDNTVIVFFDASGTARDGKPYQNTYAWFLEMLDGKVVKAFAFFDTIEFNDYWQRVSPATRP